MSNSDNEQILYLGTTHRRAVSGQPDSSDYIGELEGLLGELERGFGGSDEDPSLVCQSVHGRISSVLREIETHKPTCYAVLTDAGEVSYTYSSLEDADICETLKPLYGTLVLAMAADERAAWADHFRAMGWAPPEEVEELRRDERICSTCREIVGETLARKCPASD